MYATSCKSTDSLISFAAGLTKAVNEELWEKITLVEADDLDTSEFFDIYEKHLGNQFEDSWN